MKKIITDIDKITLSAWLAVLGVMMLLSVFITAKYNMNDSPYFDFTKGFEIVIILSFIAIYYAIFKLHKFIEEKIPYALLIAFTVICASGFVLALPIATFSDSQQVVDGALMFAKGDWNGILNSEYLQHIMKNMKLSMFYSVFIVLLPKSVISLRMINVAFYTLVCIFSAKTVRNILGAYEKTTYIIIGTFLPLLLYVNQVYFDIPVLLSGVLAVYFYTKEKKWTNSFLVAIFLGIAISLRIMGLLFAIAIFVDYVSGLVMGRYTVSISKKKTIVCIAANVIILLLLTKGVDFLLQMFFVSDNSTNETIWFQFWMGINGPEFGMMHNEYLYCEPNIGFKDFIALLADRTLGENITLFSKKIFWLWTQGTYQCQRYGFGLNTDVLSDKFIYDTFLTSHFQNDSQFLPSIAIVVSRSQYMALMIWGAVGLFRGYIVKNYEKIRLFLYLFAGTFLILVLYELKSRYIFHLIPGMILFAMYGMETIAVSKTDFKEMLIRNKKRSRVLVASAIVIALVFSAICGNDYIEGIRSNAKKEENSIAAQNFATPMGLSIIERSICIPNISRDYQFLYVADTHALVPVMDELPAWGINTQSRIDQFKNTAGIESSTQLSTWINVANALNVDATLLGGDIIDYGNQENIDWLNEQLSCLASPYLYTMGNHDSFNIMENRQDFENPNVKALFINEDVYCGYIEYDDFVVCQVNDALNCVPEKALEEFKKVYSIGKPIILVAHVPLYTECNQELKSITEELRGEDRLIGYGLDYDMDNITKEFFDLVVADDSPVILVLDGHVHFNHEDLLNGVIPEYTVGSATDGQAYLITITQ